MNSFVKTAANTGLIQTTYNGLSVRKTPADGICDRREQRRLIFAEGLFESVAAVARCSDDHIHSYLDLTVIDFARSPMAVIPDIARSRPTVMNAVESP